MLERFKVPVEDQVRVEHGSLHRTTAAVFEAMGEGAEDADTAADVLVTADLRGVETHGVSNMLRRYVDYYREGRIKARPNWSVVRETPGTATIDADRGLVLFIGPPSMEMAIAKARDVGVGVVTINNSGHSGAIGYHAMLAAKQDMVGLCMTTGGASVIPTFASKPMISTDPIAIAAPARNEPPFLFDAAMSAIAGNKLWLARRVGANLLPGWVADGEGTPMMRETTVDEVGEKSILTVGGTREMGSHKGYGFAMMGEILGAVLSGATPAMLDGPDTQSHMFAAYNIDAFTDVDAFKDTMDETLRTLKNTKPAPGHERVIYPGLSEYEEEQDRRANGIPIHREVIEWIEGAVTEFSLPPLTIL